MNCPSSDHATSGLVTRVVALGAGVAEGGLAAGPHPSIHPKEIQTRSRRRRKALVYLIDRAATSPPSRGNVLEPRSERTVLTPATADGIRIPLRPDHPFDGLASRARKETGSSSGPKGPARWVVAFYGSASPALELLKVARKSKAFVPIKTDPLGSET